jgi:hypothetical protein
MADEAFDLGFSTADAQHPSLEFRTGVLHLRFIDWREKSITAIFEEVVEFQWSDEDSTSGNWDYRTYVVCDSPRLSQCQRAGIATAEHKHFRLCFNELGVLEVLASGISVRS